MGKTGETRSERGGAKRRRTVLFQDGLGALSVAAFLFLGATIREVNLLMALGSFFAGFAVLDYWQGRRSLRRLRVERRLPDAIFAGKPFDVEIVIDATRRRSSAWGIVVEDEWTRQEDERELWASAKREKTGKSGEAERKGEKRRKGEKGKKNGEAQGEARPNVAATTRPTAYFPRVKGGERRRERYSGLVARRGVRRLSALTASTRFPCGFFRSSERFDAPAEALVFPKIGVLTERWDAAFGAARREATVSTARSFRVAGETLTVRDWRPDDSKKAIHWRATAKRDKLQARDFEKRENSVKILILDLFFKETNAAKRDFDVLNGQTRWIGEQGRNKKNRGKNGKEKKFKGANGDDAQEAARRLALVEKAVSFAATLLDSWARLNDVKFLLAINGDESAAFKKSDVGNAKKSSDWEKRNELENGSVWDGSVESGSGALRRALTRLATVETPRRDRLAEIAASLAPRLLANAQVFIVSVAPLDAVASEGTEEMEGMKGMDKTGAEARGLGERWSGARRIDVSAANFNDYFEF